jgi:hypothetical protein
VTKVHAVGWIILFCLEQYDRIGSHIGKDWFGKSEILRAGAKTSSQVSGERVFLYGLQLIG